MEIKCRAWNPSCKKFSYFEGLELVASKYSNGDFLGIKSIDTTYITPYKNPQMFTGLKDKNGKEIYEGDILKSDYGEELGIAYSEVIFMDGMFMAKENENSYPDPLVDVAKDAEIVGNNCENPDLLEGDINCS